MKKLVLKLEFHDDKRKQKVMKTVSGLPGVESISMDMKEKKLTVIGDTDPVRIVAKLRKLCHTEILTVGPAQEPKKDEPKKPELPKQEPKKPEPPKQEPKKPELPKQEANKNPPNTNSNQNSTPSAKQQQPQQQQLKAQTQGPAQPHAHIQGPAQPQAYIQGPTQPSPHLQGAAQYPTIPMQYYNYQAHYPPPLSPMHPYYQPQAHYNAAPPCYNYYKSVEEDHNSCVIC